MTVPIKTNVVDHFKQNVLKHPDQLLYVFLNQKGHIVESYTYHQFDIRTQELAHFLKEKKKLKTNDRVLLAYPPGLEMIVAFFACARAGIIPVPVYPPSSNGFTSALEKMNYIAVDCGASAVLTDRTFYWSMQVNRARDGIKSLKLKRNYVLKLPWIISGEETALLNPWIDQEADILFIQYTSGSTHDPKGVMVSHENIIANCKSVVDHTPIGVSWLPQYHDMGLIGYYLFFAIRSGTTYGFSPLDFIQRPALWFEAITKYKGTATSAPNFAYEFCLRPGKIQDEELSGYDLSSLRFVMTAAEPVRPETSRRFLDKFAQCGLNSEAFFAAFGLAEYTLAVSNYGRKSLLLDKEALKSHHIEISTKIDAVEIQSCGVLLGDTAVKIVKTDEATLTEGNKEIGEIWISGSGKCRGYWNRETLSKERFEATLPNDNRSWLRTGDLGFMHDDELYICGRLKDMILIRGMNFYPQDIESIIEKEPGIRKGCVAAFSINSEEGESLVVVAELKKGAIAPKLDTINQRVTAYLGIYVSQVVFIPARSIPKTSSGKLRRDYTKQLFLTNHFDKFKLHSAQGDVMQSDNPLTELFQRYQLSGTETDNLVANGFDSIKTVEFAHDLQKLLGELGFGYLANELDIRVLQRISITELFTALSDLLDAKPQAGFLFKKALIKIHETYSKEEQALMRNDLETYSFELNEDVVINQGNPQQILLTGATGFVGPFLLKSLLEHTQATLCVLIRAENEIQAQNRIEKAFDTVEPSAKLRLQFKERVKVILGDLTLPHLGLTQESWHSLSEDVDEIYHNGALVNYLLDYSNMRPANVFGTQTLIQLANSVKRKTFNYISTTFIFGWSVKDVLLESDRNEAMENLDFGYSQSKWVSEQIVHRAIEKGLPGRIFRPALISPSIDGQGYNFDIAIRLLSFMVRHGISTDAKNQVSFTPADLFATNAVAICQDPESLNQCFHMTRDTYASMKDITGILSEIEGVNMKYHPLRTFVPEVVSQCKPNDVLFPLLNFLVKSVDQINKMEVKLYDNSNYRKFRDRQINSVPDPSLEEIVRGIHIFMKKEKII